MYKTIMSAVGVTALFLAVPFAAMATEPGDPTTQSGSGYVPDILVNPAAARPTVSISIPRYTNKSTVSITITKTDPSGSGITGYYVSENPATPGMGAAGWKGQKPGSFTLSAGEGSKVVYAWVKNRDGQISLRDSDNTDVDKTDPSVSLTAPASSLTRHIDLTITGSDDTGAVGSPPGQSSVAPPRRRPAAIAGRRRRP